MTSKKQLRELWQAHIDYCLDRAREAEEAGNLREWEIEIGTAQSLAFHRDMQLKEGRFRSGSYKLPAGVIT